MHDVPVEIRATRSPTSFTPRGLEGYATNSHALDGPGSGVFATLSPTLGPDGSVTVPIPLSFPSQSGPENVQLEATIADVSKAFAAGHDSTVLVHAADVVLGLRVHELGSVYVGKPVHAEIVAADVFGSRKPGTQVHIELRRQTNEGAAFLRVAA